MRERGGALSWYYGLGSGRLFVRGALIQGNTVSTTSTFLRPFIFPFIFRREKEAFALTSHHPQRAYYFSSLVFNLFNASRCLYTEFGLEVGAGWGLGAWDSYEQPASLPAKCRQCVACVEWRFWPASEWRSRESARTRAPISSRHHCPRPPCLFCASDQNSHATQARKCATPF